MIYLFIGALLIITSKAQDISDLTPCTISDNCVNASAPICANLGVIGSFCTPCTTTTECTDNVEAYGPGFECIDFDLSGLATLGICAPESSITVNITNDTSGVPSCSSNAECLIPGFNICEAGDCVMCVNDTDCTNSIYYGEGYACQYNPFAGFSLCLNDTSSQIVSCSEDDDCSSDETCEYNAIFGIRYCSNETLPFCSSSADCVDLSAGSPITASCQNYTTFLGVNGTNTTIPINVPYCIPDDQCYNNTDCPGGLCLTNPDLGFRYCQIDFNGTCTDAADCPGDQACYVPEGACYTPCNNDTDCGVFVCLSPEPGINACLPPGFNFNTTIDFNITINFNITNDTDTDLSALCTVCGGDEDCDDFTEDGGVCTEFPLFSASCCVPAGIKLCSGNDECLKGQECIIEAAGQGSCETVYVTGCDPYSDDCDEGLTCFDASNYDNIDNFCYLGCTEETQDTDCGDGYICGSELYEDTIDLPKCEYDATTLGTDSPTMEPTGSPTTAAPTEDSDDETNPSYGQQLAIFGGMIIMFVHALFM